MHSLKWQKRFINLAKEIASWSHDPSTKVGAVIADENKIIRGVGYNSFPRGIKDSKERYENRELKYELTVHAEVNAILNSHGNLDNCSLYVWPTIMVPCCCPNCAKFVAQTGIKEVLYLEKDDNVILQRWEKQAEITKLIFTEAGIRCFTIPKY